MIVDFKYSDCEIVTIKIYPEFGASYKARIQIPRVDEEMVEAWIDDNLKNVQSWEFWNEENSCW